MPQLFRNSTVLRLTTSGPQWAMVSMLFGMSLLLAATVNDGFSISISEKQLSAIEAKYTAAGRKRVSEWVKMVASNQGKPVLEKLVLVNNLFNQNVLWVSDFDHYGVADYWATPLETLASGGGDCEDYAIGKYFTLLALKVPMDTLKITYVKAQNVDPINQSHMVLTYYATPGAMPLVLDNLNPEIKPASERPDLAPVYSFNGQGLWLAKERSSGKSITSGPGGISLWRDMLSRMGKEFE
jgi:predicted transglutaminase-like cysteine proteinase